MQTSAERMRVWRAANPEKVAAITEKARLARAEAPRIESRSLCRCGCGLPTEISRYTDARRGTTKGEPLALRHGHSLTGAGRWKKDRIKHESRGYSTPCWIWLLKTDRVGYGRMGFRGKEWLAHRYYYTEHIGPIPDGFVVDHLCSVKSCVNPDHLEAVTPQENEWRAWMKRASLTMDQIDSLKEWMVANLPPEQLKALWSSYRWSNGRK